MGTLAKLYSVPAPSVKMRILLLARRGNLWRDAIAFSADEAMSVRDNDLTIIPYGYHPVAAPPGYDVYYLWFLSGPRRLLLPNDDPDHVWVKNDPQEPRHYP